MIKAALGAVVVHAWESGAPEVANGNQIGDRFHRGKKILPKPVTVPDLLTRVTEEMIRNCLKTGPSRSIPPRSADSGEALLGLRLRKRFNFRGGIPAFQRRNLRQATYQRAVSGRGLRAVLSQSTTNAPDRKSQSPSFSKISTGGLDTTERLEKANLDAAFLRRISRTAFEPGRVKLFSKHREEFSASAKPDAFA
jgi:hypothetical protein